MESKSFISRIISNPIIQTLAVYISGSWVLIEITQFIVNRFELNEKFINVFLVILLCGLPVALVIAWLVSREKRPVEGQASGDQAKIPTKSATLFRKPALTIPGLIIFLLIIVVGIRYFNHRAKVRWAREEALPELGNLRSQGEYSEAFNLVKEVEKYIPDDPDFLEYDSILVRELTIFTDPPGAEVYFKFYEDTSDNFENVGTTPIEDLELPRAAYYLVKIEKTGYEKVMAIASCYQDTFYRKLFPEGTIPEGMVYVDGYGDEVTGNHLGNKNGFFIDKYEVTNEQYKEFVDQGGYRKPEFWKHEFIKDGKTLSWEEAMTEFTDQSGRPGPSTWQASDYQEDRDDYPVGGLSWYEAAAYAEFIGKELPGMHHWSTAAGQRYYMMNYYNTANVIKKSNFNRVGPEPVGTNPGINAFGTYDMAGNVREWCMNETSSGHVIRGGGWDDAEYMYGNQSQLPSWDRSSKNGLRCVLYINKDKIPEEAFEPAEFSAERDFYAETPVEEKVFEVFRNQFMYDEIALDALVENTDDSQDDWIREKITFNAAYNDERMIAYLYLPRNGTPPYQTMIFFPGSFALQSTNFNDDGRMFYDYLLKNGRAVMYPVYNRTFERNKDQEIGNQQSHQYTEWITMWVKDLRRSIDYLETRQDIDTNKIGFLGHSWGGRLGGLILAVEDRLKLGVFITGGMSGRPLPEADPFNYVTRVKIPVLFLNGKFDATFPFESTVKPYYDYLGTPEPDKKLVLTETDHWIPKQVMIKETLDWMDTYFEPVK